MGLAASLLRSFEHCHRPRGGGILPYTLAMDWLGYVDFDVAFFALLGVLIVSGGRGAGRLLAAGFAFGAALLTKPQALTLALMFAGLVLFGVIWSRRRRELVRDA